MSRITRELLQKRAEHNEKMLINLEEIALHQQEILKIENIDVHCRHIKILLLQNNIIDKMENLNKLKELEYLNLALNNIVVIEGIQGCESLQKLDLTVNFIDVDTLEESVNCLSKCELMKELYLTGNPCTDWKGCRDYIIAQVPSLQLYDGKEIPPSERIKAIQNLPFLKESLKYKIEEKQIKDEQKQHEGQLKKEQKQEQEQQNGLTQDEEQKFSKEEKVDYNRESRKEMYLQMAKEKEDKERRKNPENYVQKEPSSMLTKDGKIRQCDEGGYKPTLNQWDDPTQTVFLMKVPKFLDTSLLEVNLNPSYVSVRVKDEEIIVEKSTIQRSQTTGELVITMPKLTPNYTLQKIYDSKKQNKDLDEKSKLKHKQENQKQQDEQKELMMQRIEAKTLIKTTNSTTLDDVPDLE